MISERDALLNAVQLSVYKAMAEAVRQSRAYFARDLRNGIAYDVIVVNTPDDRVMRSFMKALEAKVKEVRILSASGQQTHYQITLSGTVSDLKDMIYAASGSTTGLEGMSLVALRGKSLTFDAGM